MDRLAERLHTELRAEHPRAPRPLVLNTWEAVYFDHDADRPLALADQAAELGVERGARRRLVRQPAGRHHRSGRLDGVHCGLARRFASAGQSAGRVRYQLWTSLLLPPELVASHVGASESHTTHRVTATPFRLITALFAHAGIECDISQCSEQELRLLRNWVALYRELRELIHTGRTVHADLPDPATLLHGAVARDGARAIFAWVRLMTSGATQSGRVRFPGLSAAASYRVRVRPESARPACTSAADRPGWTAPCTAG